MEQGQSLSEKKWFQKNETGKIEWCVFCFYVIAMVFIACFHEPWYDEAEAWQMARGASFSDLFFYIPHYEGHPALWYLLLAIPAKLGVPYELGLKSIACGVAFVYGWLLLFLSPFPRVLRLLLPFHYFFFFQYGIVSRPYGISVLCFLLMAMAFKTRKEKPVKFVIPMAFLCATSGYGIILAGGICIAWVLEICMEKNWKIFSADFWKDKRILSLAVLLLIAVLIILEIMPREDTYAVSQAGSNSLLTRLLYTFFVMLPDSTVLTVLEGAAFLNRAMIAFPVMLIGIILGVLLLCLLISAASRKTLPYFIIPYVLFALFSAFVYFCAHHMGMMLAFTIFWLWITLEDPDKYSVGRAIWGKVKIAESDKKSLQKLGIFGLAILVIIPLYWSVTASVLDVLRPYYYGRDMAEFLKQTGLYKAKVMASYDIYKPFDEDEEVDVYSIVNTQIVARPVAVLPYFEHNFCLNLNMGKDSGGYALHRLASPKENEEVMNKWQEMGLPEVVIGPMNLEFVFGEEAKTASYVPVYEYPPYVDIWKAFTSRYNITTKQYVYVRLELLEQYGLKQIMQSDFK